MKHFYILLFILCASTSINAQKPLVWSFSTKAGVYSSPTIDRNFIYVGSNDSCLYALNKVDGKLKWKFKTQGEIKSKPLLHNGSVIFNSTDGLLYSLDKTNSELQWTFKTEGEKNLDMWDYYLSSPVFYKDLVFFGSGDGNVYAIDPTSGKEVWKHKTEGIVHATPVAKNNRIYIGSFDGVFYALDYSTGGVIWTFKTVGAAYFPNGEIQKGAALFENSVIFGSRDYNIYSLDIETGRGLWNMKERGSWVIATPLVYKDAIYFGTSDTHRFYGLNAKNGGIKWTIPLNMRVYGEAVPYEEQIIFGCFNGKLYTLNHSNGEVEQIFQTEGSKKNYYNIYNENDAFKEDFEIYGNNAENSEKKILELGAILSTPAIENGIVYFGDANGIIYAVKIN